MSGHIGKLPQPREKPFARALFQSIFFVALQNEHGSVLLPPLPLGGLDREGFRGAMLISETNFPTRAAAAFRFSVGAADGGTQLHQRLREVTGSFRVNGGKPFPDAGFHGGQIDGEGSSVSREKTRSTLPSTAGTGRSKAMEQTAPAVYSPIPGSARTSSYSLGNWPL